VPQRRRADFRNAAPSSERLSGTVTRWEPGSTYGFITGDDSVSYFLSNSDLPRGLTGLAEGTRVTFTSSIAPKPGVQHLRALSVQIEAPS
jgi:cold shock CspA family protein